MSFKNLILISFLVILAISERLWLDLGPNVELITTAMIIAGIYLGRKFGIVVPLIIIALTDAFMGNTNILLFTWSAFALEGLAAFLIARKISFRSRGVVSKLFTSSAMGVGASLWFYLWTNFGVWALDNFGMYPNTIAGLIECYLAGLPFLKLNLLSNLFFVPLGIFTWELLSLPSSLFNIFSKPAPQEV